MWKLLMKVMGFILPNNGRSRKFKYICRVLLYCIFITTDVHSFFRKHNRTNGCDD